jgi:hypothetical protein
MRKTLRCLAPWLLAAAAVATAWWLFAPSTRPLVDRPAAKGAVHGVSSVTIPQMPAAGGGFSRQAVVHPDPLLRAALQATLSDWRRQAPSREEALDALARLKELAHQGDPSAAAEALIMMLEEGADQSTGLGFVVGEEGVMDETPTLRAALLDLLGQTDPFLSADYARRLLGQTESADEYALALRNLAWSDSKGRLAAELREGFRAMLQRGEWMANPTAGFLEAFDVAVEIGSVEELARLIPVETGAAESPVTRAAFIALDRLTIRQPSIVTAWLERDPSALAHAPSYRASLMSRWDVRDPAQAAVLARYLQRADLSSDEWDYFAGLFPNGNYFTGHRLVGSSWDAPESAAARDQATLSTLSAWRDLPEFAAGSAALAAIVERLRTKAIH